MSESSLKRGDLVEVRSAGEILQTLDAQARLDCLPFMAEMVAYCGRRFAVDRRAEKVCDTITDSMNSRHMADTVFLEDLRCDGRGHGGCQAECRFYWKEAWLRRVTDAAPRPEADPAAAAALLELVTRAATAGDDVGTARYRCQATEMVAATSPLSTTDPRPYLRELKCGNVGVGTFVKVMSRAAVVQPLHSLGRLPNPPVKGSSSKSPQVEALDLQPGEWVRVRSREQIQATLTDKGKHRGLWFDREMLPMCGQVFQVRSRVTKIIDERTGRMIELDSDCIVLENSVCSGERSTSRWFCPREIYSYWRECWLERVPAPIAASA